MIYVFDTSSLSKLKHFYPTVFKSIWNGLERLAEQGSLISTKEVWNELQKGSPVDFVNQWLESRKALFKTPGSEELQFVAQILAIEHFQTLIGETQRLKGTPVADPFVIACAKIHQATVVTEEKEKPHAAKIPNVCSHFNIPCVNLETFMTQQGWEF